MSRYLGDEFPLPPLTPNNTPYFTSGSIQIQFCDDCNHAQHPPDDVCYACQSWNLSFREMPGTGRIESSAIVHHAVHPALGVTDHAVVIRQRAAHVGSAVAHVV